MDVGQVRQAAPRAKRSSNGCATCVQAKVKCPENRPVCQRCQRLHRQCSWPSARPPLRERRRGLGPLKSRDSYVPRPIQPISSTIASAEERGDGNYDEERLDDGGANPSIRDRRLLASPARPSRLSAVAPSALSPALAEMVCFTTPIPLTLSAWHVPSPSSVPYGPLEQDALYFFENNFGNFGPKTFLWSPLAILLRFAFDDETIMHLLLAACLNQMSQGCSDSAMRRAAMAHFVAGSTSLIGDLQAEKIDHRRSMMSFWLLQLTYRSVWDEKAFVAMRRLSASVAHYVRKHCLLDQFRPSRGNSEDDLGRDLQNSDLQRPRHPADKSVLARFLLFSAYEDLDSDFCDAGGELSSLVLSENNTSEALFTFAQNSHTDYFGPDYPLEELMDDIERSRPLEMHLRTNIVLGQINRIRKQANPSIQQLREAESSLYAIRQRYSNLFQLAEAQFVVSKKLISTTVFIVAHFKAVLVCALEALVSFTGDESIVQSLPAARQDLVRSVYIALKYHAGRERNALLWRNDWPVFVAAVEAEDIIHADWMLQKLGDGRYATLYKKRSGGHLLYSRSDRSC